MTFDAVDCIIIAKGNSSWRWKMFDRISIDPKVCGGQPCIKNTRIPVHIILDLLAAGDSEREILEAYPHLCIEDITAAVKYAAYMVREENQPIEVEAIKL